MSLAAWTLAAIAWLAPIRDDAAALAGAIAEASEEAPLWEGGAKRTAALLVAIAWREAHFAVDADRGDEGRACSVFQLHAGRDCMLVERDVYEAARRAREALRISLRTCAGRPLAERWGIYMSGKCGRGLRESRDRWFIAGQLLKAVTP